MPIPALAIGALQGLTSFIGDRLESADAERAKAGAVAAYEKLLIPYSETLRRMDTVGDTVYTKAMTEMNTGAFAGRGSLNPEVLRTAAFAKTAGSRALAEESVAQQDFGFNRDVRKQIASVEATPTPYANPMSAIAQGIGGYFGGKQLEMSEDLSNKYGSYLEMLTNYRSNPFSLGNNYFGTGVNGIINYGLSGTINSPYVLKKKNPFSGTVRLPQ